MLPSHDNHLGSNIMYDCRFNRTFHMNVHSPSEVYVLFKDVIK